MTEAYVKMCCSKCGEVFKGSHAKHGYPTDWIEWSLACEKLAKVWLDDWLKNSNACVSMEGARLWVIENVLKAGWTHNE